MWHVLNITFAWLVSEIDDVANIVVAESNNRQPLLTARQFPDHEADKLPLDSASPNQAHIEGLLHCLADRTQSGERINIAPSSVEVLGLSGMRAQLERSKSFLSHGLQFSS
jgi:hypothetical protein